MGIRFFSGFAFGLLVGVFAGAVALAYYFYEERRGTDDTEIQQIADVSSILRAVLPHSAVIILDEKFSCESLEEKSVGAVLTSIVAFESADPGMSIRAGCMNSDPGTEICTISISNCRPWQRDSCGSRILKFTKESASELSAEKFQAKANSFECLDVP